MRPNYKVRVPLKDLDQVLTGGGIKSRFSVYSKLIILRSRYRSEVGQLFPRRYDLLGPLRLAHPTQKYLHT